MFLLHRETPRGYLQARFAHRRHCIQSNGNRHGRARLQGRDLHPACAGAVCCASASWTHGRAPSASEPAKPAWLAQTARERLRFLKGDVQQDKWRILRAAEEDITRSYLMELIKEKFQFNIVMFLSVSPGLVRLVQLCNNHPGKQMKFCHIKNGRIIWHIIQTHAFWNSSALAGG